MACPRAFDPHLDRKIALKIGARGIGGRHTRRVLAEARAMGAANRNPNFFAVLHVPPSGPVASLYLAMERYSGQNLGRWLSAPRSLAQIHAVFLEPGRQGWPGPLPAGLVPWRCKPANLPPRRDGMVKVADFGPGVSEASASRFYGEQPGVLAPELLAGNAP